VIKSDLEYRHAAASASFPQDLGRDDLFSKMLMHAELFVFTAF